MNVVIRHVRAGLTNADQRITEDVEKFCFAVADLYSYTFKPLLDVLLFTRSLAKSMGYRTQLALYAYYLLSATVLRSISPPLALMTAQETGLAGAFRSAHQVQQICAGHVTGEKRHSQFRFKRTGGSAFLPARHYI